MKKLLFLLMLVTLVGAGCTPSTTIDTTGLTLNDVSVYEAPSNWARYWNIDEGWSFRYPGEYTADLDFETRIVKITDRETNEELIHVRYDGEELYFEEVGENVVWLYEIVGTTQFD